MGLPFRIAAALPLLAAGPCFQLRIANDVEVHADGSSRRTTSIERTDAEKLALGTPGETRVAKPPVLWITAEGAFRPERAAESSDGDVASRVVRTRLVEPGQRVRDLTLRRGERGPAAANEAVARADDFGVFRRVRYLETIRDGADRESAAAAARRLADFAASAADRAAIELFGATYDLAPMHRYLLGPGKQAVAELLLASLETGLDPSAGADALLAILDREGVAVDRARFRRVLAGEPHEPGDEPALLESLVAGGVAKCASLLRRAGATDASPGEPVKPEELAFLRREGAVADAFRRSFAATSSEPDALKRAMDDAQPELFGSFGGALFDPGLGDESVRWRTQLRMPGRLIRTNGAPLPDGSILWLKLSADLALRATTMEAESVILDERAVASLGGDSSSFSTEDALELLIDLGRGRERAPDRARVETLAKAAAGDPDARRSVLTADEFDTVRRVFRIPKAPK